MEEENRPVRVTMLYENRCGDPGLQEGWGFSALVEYGESRILFDTGGDPRSFSMNAQKLKVPYEQITHLLFSHRHWDHIGGFRDVVQRMPSSAGLYLPRSFPLLLRRRAARHLKTTIVRSFQEIGPDVYSLVLRGGFWLYEQVLVLKTPMGLGIVTGCAHPGIVQIIESAQKHLGADIAFVLGGFHLLFTAPEKTARVVEKFRSLGVEKVAPCHCSGDHLIRQFQNAYGPDCLPVGTGTTLTF
jgi:7,8-dihydropterin-6-yl-methyl-4-(beta-D-ribofuranosyl)aminobenzene 5'-phosphate synthase